MAFKQQSPLDMTGLEILNARLQNVAGQPSSPGLGQVWLNTVTGKLEFKGTSATIDPTARASHTGSQLASTISDFDAQVRTSRLDQMASPTASVALGSQKITGLLNGSAAQDAAAFGQIATAVSALRLNTIAASADVALGGFKITGLANGVAASDAAAFGQIATAVSALRLNTISASGDVAFGGFKLTGVAPGTLGTDGVNKTQLDAVTASITSTRLDQFAAPTAAVSMNSQRLTNLGAPVSANDAARLTDLQSIQNGAIWKTVVRVATTGNISIAAPGAAIDGVTMAANDRVLVKANTAGSENGLYVWNGAAVPMTRSTDGVQGTLLSGSIVPVMEGTTNQDTAWRLNTDGTITVGTTAQSWGPFANPFAPVAGSGISIAGSTIALDTAVAVRKYASAIGDNSSVSIGVSHNLGTLDVTIGVYEVSSGAEVGCDKIRTSINAVTLGFAVAPTAGQFRVVIHA